MAVPTRMRVAEAMTANGAKQSSPSTSNDQLSVYPRRSASRAMSTCSANVNPSSGTESAQRFCCICFLRCHEFIVSPRAGDQHNQAGRFIGGCTERPRAKARTSWMLLGFDCQQQGPPEVLRGPGDFTD